MASHLATPFRLARNTDGTRSLAVNEQGSDEDANSRIFAVLNTPTGWLIHMPEFGRPGLTFLRPAATTHEIERVLAMWVPDVDLIALRDSGRIAELADGKDVLTVKERE
jgi:hypothetical protein